MHTVETSKAVMVELIFTMGGIARSAGYGSAQINNIK